MLRDAAGAPVGVAKLTDEEGKVLVRLVGHDLSPGFHGFHVTVGAIMLTVIWFRCLKGHFKPDHHFGFEGVAWYWHFVDVVWLGLFIFVYWL